jgi:DNA-binding IclR family transcriptional regulator
MSTTEQRMPNESFNPNDRQEQLLEVFKAGRETGNPWGRATNKYLAEQTDIRRQYVNRELDSLVDAGWVTQLTRGLYEFVVDPRETNGTE